jgi:hypothetical protein
MNGTSNRGEAQYGFGSGKFGQGSKIGTQNPEFTGQGGIKSMSLAAMAIHFL